MVTEDEVVKLGDYGITRQTFKVHHKKKKKIIFDFTSFYLSLAPGGLLQPW